MRDQSKRGFVYRKWWSITLNYYVCATEKSSSWGQCVFRYTSKEPQLEGFNFRYQEASNYSNFPYCFGKCSRHSKLGREIVHWKATLESVIYGSTMTSSKNNSLGLVLKNPARQLFWTCWDLVSTPRLEAEPMTSLHLDMFFSWPSLSYRNPSLVESTRTTLAQVQGPNVIGYRSRTP